MNMYLNDFRKEIVLAVFDELLKTKKDLIFAENLSDITRKEADKEKHLILNYDSLLYRIFLYKLDIGKPLFSNPRCICKIASKAEFIRSIFPSKEYKQIMSQN